MTAWARERWRVVREAVRCMVDREVALAQAKARGDILEAALLRARRELEQERRRAVRT